MTSPGMILQSIINISLFFLLALVPLMVNPTAYDYFYKPKIDSVYGLICIICAAVIARLCIRRVGLPLPRLAGPVFLFLYGCSAIISTVLSIDRKLSLQGDFLRYEGLFTLLAYAALPVLFAGLVESRMQAEQLVKWLLASSFLIALYGVIQYLGFNPTRHFIDSFNVSNVINSTMGNGNFLGKFLVLTGPLFAGYCLYKNEKKTYLLCSFALVFVVMALVLSMARASWLGFACAALLFALLIFRYGGPGQKRYIGVFGGAIAGAALVFGVFAASGWGSFNIGSRIAAKARAAFNLQQGHGSATRIFLWGQAVPLIAERPWFGYGPDTHVQVYKKASFESFKRFKASGIIDRAHNNYIDIAIGQGIFGLFAYCGIMVSFLVWLWRCMKRETDRRLRMLLCAVFSSYCGYMVNDFFSFSVVSVSPTFWALMGLTYALQRSDTSEDMHPPGAAVL
ncbi:MAG: O-antigen ligase family protein [Deltaproteobacteria bacterium]|nr:O-antigen ligase family protein [Deltaproteobacteria bacterium]